VTLAQRAIVINVDEHERVASIRRVCAEREPLAMALV